MRSGSITIAIGLALLIGLAPQAIRPVSAVSTLVVSVGYADDLRASPFFPNPWCGGLNVALCSGNNAQGSGVDSGAIKLDNPTGSDISVTSVVVTLPGRSGPPTFNLWGSFTVPAGKSVILDQTSQFNFDTSDFPINGCGTPDGNSANAPTVDITVGGVKTTYTDVGRVLDTGGFDRACNGSNESLNWRPITSTCGITCPGGVGVPEFPLPAAVAVAVAFAAIMLARKAGFPGSVSATNAGP